MDILPGCFSIVHCLPLVDRRIAEAPQPGALPMLLDRGWNARVASASTSKEVDAFNLIGQ